MKYNYIDFQQTEQFTGAFLERNDDAITNEWPITEGRRRASHSVYRRHTRRATSSAGVTPPRTTRRASRLRFRHHFRISEIACSLVSQPLSPAR